MEINEINAVQDYYQAEAVDKRGSPHKITGMGEDVLGWAVPVDFIVLDNGTTYYFTDLFWQHELDNSPLRAGKTVYIYPMQPEEIFRDHKFHKATHWLEDEDGNRWRMWKPGGY